MSKLKSNIWKLSLYKFLSDFLLIVPVMVPFYQANHLSTSEFLLLQSIYSTVVVLLEIPSGYLADVIGRRKTLILGGLFFPIAVAAYALSHSFWGFALAEFLWAISGSLRSGCDSALLYDSLLALERVDTYKTIQGRVNFIERFGTGISAILGGLLALISIRMPFYINAITGIGLFIVSIFFIEPPRLSPTGHTPFRDIIRIGRHCVTHPTLRALALYQAIFTFSGVAGVWLSFLYYTQLGLSVAMNGFIFFGFQLCCGLASANLPFVERFIPRRQLHAFLLLVGFCFLALAWFHSPWMILVIGLSGLFWGTTTPLVLNDMNAIVDSSIRATVLSISAMVGRTLLLLGLPFVGWVSDHYSLSHAYALIGIGVLLGGYVTLQFIPPSLLEKTNDTTTR